MASAAQNLYTKSSPSVAAPIVLAERVLFSLLFLMASFNHFKSQTIAYTASQGVPLASIAVPLSGVIALLGALSILVGYKAKLGGWLIALFLIGVTPMMHKFWGRDGSGDAADPDDHVLQESGDARWRAVDYPIRCRPLERGQPKVSIGAGDSTLSVRRKEKPPFPGSFLNYVVSS